MTTKMIRGWCRWWIRTHWEVNSLCFRKEGWREMFLLFSVTSWEIIDKMKSCRSQSCTEKGKEARATSERKGKACWLHTNKTNSLLGWSRAEIDHPTAVDSPSLMTSKDQLDTSWATAILLWNRALKGLPPFLHDSVLFKTSEWKVCLLPNAFWYPAKGF